MVCRLIDFVFVVLNLLVFKFSGITGISKTEFFSFSDTEKVKQNQKKIKNYSKRLNLVSQSLFNSFQQNPNIVLVFH